MNFHIQIVVVSEHNVHFFFFFVLSDTDSTDCFSFFKFEYALVVACVIVICLAHFR